MLPQNKELYEFDGFHLNVSERLLLDANGDQVPLTDKVFAVLCQLARQSGSLVRKEDLLAAVWDGAFVEENNLDKAVSALRRALGEKRGEKVFIETVRKHGFRFVAQVARVEIEETTINFASPNLPSASKTHGYRQSALRCGNNVPHIADRQPEPETESSENFPPPVESRTVLRAVSPSEVPPVGVNRERRGWSSNRIAGWLIGLIFLGGGLAFSVNRHTESKAADAPDFSERANFRQVAGSDGGYSPTIAPDGKTAAYRDENSFIWLENLSNGSRLQIKNGEGAAVKGIWLKFAPDGNDLYYVWKSETDKGNAIYRVSVPNGTPRKIVDDAWTGAAVSPDGKQIAFARLNAGANEHALLIVNADGTNERQLASHLAPNWFTLYGNYVAWSPDGKKIAAVGGAPGYRVGEAGSIVVVNVADGAESTVQNPVWQNTEFDELTWAADGKSLFVVARDANASPYQIWQVSYPAGVWRRVTNDLDNYARVEASADGKTLITAQEKTYSRLWRMPFGDTSRAKQLTFGSSYKVGNAGLDIAPDGNKIIYASSETGNYEIWSANADGANRRQLTFGSEAATEPTVTPDNRYIVFLRQTNGASHLWRMNTDGGELLQLTDGAGEFGRAAVTPDSRSVIYAAYSQPPKTDLYRISIDGGAAMRLTDKFGGSAPAVSPDGKWIAYSFYDYETAETPWRAGIMPLDGGAPVKSFEMPLRGLMRWTTDSRSLLHLGKDWCNLWQTPIFGGGSPQPTTDFKDQRIARFAVSPDGKQIFLARAVTETNLVLIESGK